MNKQLRLCTIGTLVLFLLAVTLSAFAVRPVSAADGGVFLRVAHLAPTAPAVDVYVNDKKVVTNLAYPNVSDYLPLQGKDATIKVTKTGSTDGLAKEPLMLMGLANGYYTVAAAGALEDKSFILIKLPADGSAAMTMPMATPAATAAALPEKGKAMAGDFMVEGAYARATAAASMSGMSMGGNDKVSAAYMKISNMGKQADTLIGVACECAKEVGLHESVVENDIAKMIPRPEGFEIAAGGSVELKAGGKHIMLMGLKDDLVAGQFIKLTLKFKSGFSMDVNVPVLPATA